MVVCEEYAGLDVLIVVLFHLQISKYPIVLCVSSRGDPVFASCLLPSLVAFSSSRALDAPFSSHVLPAGVVPLRLFHAAELCRQAAYLELDS